MRSAIMLPENKSGRVVRKVLTLGKEINSYSTIEKDVSSALKGTKMRSLGYKIDAKKIWMNL